MNPNECHRSAPRAAGLCLAAATLAVVPSLGAFAADSAGAPTIRATIGDDGAVSSAKQISTDGNATDFGGQMPVSLKITHTQSGGQQNYAYHVENTFSQTQTLNYVDTLGNTRHTSIQLQLPLVAQLGVTVPESAGALTAPGATISTDTDGTRHVLWNMVLFTPLGSAAQDVTFTAAGSGKPVAELRATAVDPTTTPGLSSASQAASSGYQQDDFWAGYANGGNEGLVKLSDGMGQLVDGLVQAYAGATQLHNGIADAQAGAVQLDDGTAQAYDGSKQLSAGLGKIHGGLGQLANKKKGLPAALDGVSQLKAGVDKVLAGIGDAKTSNTLVNGAEQLAGGLDQLVAAFGSADDSAAANPGIAFGLRCAEDAVDLIVNGNATATPDVCFATLGGSRPALPALKTIPGTAIYSTILGALLDQALTPINQGIATEVVPGLKALASGARQIRAGLSTGDKKNPGVKEGLDQISAGLGELKTGLKKAVVGIGKLDAGSGKAYSGSQDLTDGLSQLSDGQHQVATGLPAAVDGTGQLADGLGQAVDGGKQIHDGIDQVHTDALGPLEKQLKQASQNGHKQLAVLTAAAALGSKGPGGSGTSYVLSQNAKDFALSADSSGDSHTARNVGLGVGGAALLLIGLGSGFAMGRRRTA
jgi:putative membrane protein